MDWLELYSPMEVHWKEKWLSIPYKGKTMLLKGLMHHLNNDIVIQLQAVDFVEQDQSITHLPNAIQSLLIQFPTVLAIPTSLPPRRAYDHTIPLIEGATPVNIRAYRYPPSLKDEIEHQVHVMLEQGLIQPSKSPFSSLVLLVQKKDGAWRFCVDYRYLNALTVKFVYPIPVFDQLVDVLGSPSWFPILNLHCGYHQIRL
jgi:hypothetical protein